MIRLLLIFPDNREARQNRRALTSCSTFSIWEDTVKIHLGVAQLVLTAVGRGWLLQ
jgi:hypothetical protein